MTPDLPPNLPADQHPIWHDLVHRLTLNGQLHRADPELALGYCQAVHDHRRALELIQQSDVLTVRGRQGPKVNPALEVKAQAARQIRDLGRSLGLHRNPSPMQPAGQGTTDATCTRCDQTHNPKHCPGHSKRTGQPCGNVLGKGTKHLGAGHCYAHGGNTPSGIKHAAGLQARKTVMFRLASKGEVEPITDPLGWLADLAAEADAWKDEVAGQVNDLQQLVANGEDGTEALRALVPLLERLTRHAGSLARDMARLDIDERLISIYAQADDLLAERVALCIKAVLVELAARLPAEWRGLLDPATAQTGEVIGRHLRAIA